MDIETGTTRRIDELGRIVVPAEMRRWFHIHEKDELSIFVSGDNIIIRKADATCVFCASTTNVSSHRGRGVCETCLTELATSASRADSRTMSKKPSRKK